MAIPNYILRQLMQTCHISKLFLASIVALSLITIAQAYIVEIDAGVENECFHEKVPLGVKLGFSFEVIEGGFYDIDVEIKDPTNVILHQDERTSAGKYTIEANLEGPYQICFSNKKSSYTPKTIIFDIDRSDVVQGGSKIGSDGTKEDDETKKLMDMVESLLLATISSRHDVRFLTARDRVHRSINEATNSRIAWWSGVEFLLLLFVTLGQVWYLKRFFEIRRKA